MRIWIKARYRAALALFHTMGTPAHAAAVARVDAIDAQHMDAAAKIFTAIKSGDYDYADQTDRAGVLHIYHRSTRHDGIQCSHLCRIKGEYIPTSHTDIMTPADIIKRDSLSTGYINIRRI